MEKKFEQLESGDSARVSGFYISNHLECKGVDLWARKGSRLPVCGHCGKSATFTLQKRMEHISDDADFR